MVGPRDGFDRLDKAGLAVLGLIFVGMLLRSIEDATSVQEIVRAVGGIMVLFLILLWRYATSWLSSRQEGIVTLGIGIVSIGLLLVLVPTERSIFDWGLIAAYGGFFLYGIVRVIDLDVSIPTQIAGGALLVLGVGMIGMGLSGVHLSVGFLQGVQTVVSGGVVTVFGLVFVLRPSIINKVIE